MTNAIARTSIFAAAWRGFVQTWRIWILWVVAFALVYGVLNHFAAGAIPPELQEQLRSTDKEKSQQAILALRAYWPRLSLVGIISFLVYQSAIYAIAVTYIRAASQGAERVVLNLRDYLYFIWKKLHVMLVFFAAFFVIFFVSILAALIAAQAGKNMASPGDAIAGTATLCSAFGILFILYLMGRFALVTPLIIGRVVPELKNSAQLTKGQVWRLVWPLMAVTIMAAILKVLWVPIEPSLLGFLHIDAENPGDSGNAFLRLLNIISQFFSLLVSSFIVIYNCEAYRILSDEKRVAPTFSTQV